MPLDRRKTAILTFSALLLLGFPAIVAWRAAVWNRAGWAGLAFYGAQQSQIGTFGMFQRRPRTVIVVASGSPASRADIRPGDVIQSINGIPLERSDELRRLQARAKPGDQVRYELTRGGKPQVVRLTLSSGLRSRFLAINLTVSIFCGLIFLIVSFLVFWTKPRSRRAAVFYWMCVVGGTFFFVATIAGASGAGGLAPVDESIRWTVVFLVYSVIAVVLDNLLLHLALIFPKERPIVIRYPTLLRWVHSFSLLPIVIVIALALSFSPKQGTVWPWILSGSLATVVAAAVLNLRSRHVAEGGRWIDTLIGHPFVSVPLLVAGVSLGAALMKIFPVDRSTRVAIFFLAVMIGILAVCTIAAAYSIWTVVTLWLSYRESGVEEKRQLRWPLWGTILALGVLSVIFVGELILLNVSPTYFATRQNAAAALGVIVKLCYLLIPISFALGILKYRLMDIDLIIKKTLVYTGVTGVIVVSYLILVALLGASLVQFAGVRSQTVTVISTLAIAALFIPVRNRVQSFVDRRFFRRKYDYPQALRLISQEISKAQDLERLLHTAAEFLQQALQNRFVIIFAEAHESDRLEPVAWLGLPKELLSGVSIDKRAVRRADEMVRRLGEGDRPELHHVPAVVEVVMRTKGEILGLALFGSKLSGEEFDQEDHEFLRSAGDQLALAIDSLRVRREQQEFQQALDIQRALLPKTTPEVRGLEISSYWQPARTVGGDYFDLLKFDDARVAVCIGDVAGKGMPAALLMSSLQAAVKAIASSETDPAEVCSKVGKVVCSILSGGKFVTFFYALVDSERKRLLYANAGHNPPILLRADGSVVRLTDGGPAFARLLSSSAYRRGDVPLNSGDRLILFTDGVSEARSPENLEFGEDRLVSAVQNSGAPAQDIFAAVQDFTAGELQDDVTIVSVSVN